LETDLLIPLPARRLARRLARVHGVLVAVLVLLAAVAPTGARAGSAVTIQIGSNLTPAVVSVAPGTRVVWVNRDGDRHRVRTTSGPVELDSGNLEPGESWSTTIVAEGTYAYVDDRDRDNAAYHGRIVVSAAAPIGSAGESGGGPGASASGSGGGTVDPPVTAAVSVGDGLFAPSTVTVAAGGSVTWRNGDDRDHTATARGASFDTGSIAPGATSTKRFSAAGTFAYLCAIHPDMQGTVRVVASGATTDTPPAAPLPTPTPSRPAAEETIPASGGPGPAAATLALRIVDLAFVPSATSIAAGTMVTWTNDGVAPHTVTAANGTFDSGMLAAGATWSHTFDRAGTFRFVCAVHPDMGGVLTVIARAGSADAPASPSVAASPDGLVPAAMDVVQSPPPPVATPGSAAASVEGGGPARAAVTVLACVVAVAFFGRLIGGAARR
jgi:plastocyanin